MLQGEARSTEGAPARREDAARDGRGPIVCVIGTYPLLTTTFIDREIEALRALDIDTRVVAVRRPDPDSPLSEAQRRLADSTTYLLPVSVRALVAAHLRYLCTRPRTSLRLLAHLVTRPHPSLRARLKTVLHFGEGVYAAALVRELRPRELQAHFVDRAAVIAWVASELLGCPYSISLHAGADVFVDPVLLGEKLRGARRVVSCTDENRSHIAAVCGADVGAKIAYIRHGLDLAEYEPGPPAECDPPIVLTVAQLKPRKGLADLVAACRLLQAEGRAFRCRIVGEGPQREELEAMIEQGGLGDTVELCGALPHEAVVEEYRKATMFVLPCVRTEQGDVDGIPNVLAEAMAMQLPVLCSDLPASLELVVDGENGIVVPAGDVERLRDAIRALLDDTARRAALGLQGRRTVLEEFDVRANVGRFAEYMWPDLVPRSEAPGR